ncbi:MAG: peptide-methionine (S)-S-oxide reductase MsrA [Candidatus Thermoplasmatota archaeon]|nr:peptide-methionine (S)-S-oxide reductase MsrA [Candidatus Thermoplasmatota archaeon]
MSKAMFGAGCFWGVEYNFSKIKGVNEVISGYSGGKTPNPTYEMVCSNNTEHAEVVLIDFNENEVTYEELLSEFWKKHDPTTLNRQGPDVGTQYRSAIFYYDDRQKEAAEKSLNQLQKKLSQKIVTEITKAQKFWKAEEYHQKYFEKHGLRH